ncbi:hypothetical protein [Parageobacillus sp. G301]|nr:hypothetical protein [Parageobacillus sp. G301]
MLKPELLYRLMITMTSSERLTIDGAGGHVFFQDSLRSSNK